MDIQGTDADIPLALTERAGESVRIDTPDASGTTVTLEEAAAGWTVSLSTLRRRLNEGAVAGAGKKPSKKGDRWAIPVASLEALGYQRRDAEPLSSVPAVAVKDQQGELVSALLEQLNRQQLALEVATDRQRQDHEALTQAKVDEAVARTQAELLSAQVSALQAELEAERSQRKKRGLFRRGK
jgi:hypothetical protein